MRAEREVAKTQVAEVQFEDLTHDKMPLLRAVQLLLLGQVRQIIRPWKPGEKEQYLSGTILQIENYIDERAEGVSTIGLKSQP